MLRSEVRVLLCVSGGSGLTVVLMGWFVFSEQVSVLVLKVNSVCGSLDLRGENTAVAMEVGQVRPNQLGNVSLRQYLSNRSLGKSLAPHTHTHTHTHRLPHTYSPTLIYTHSHIKHTHMRSLPRLYIVHFVNDYYR